MKGMELAERLYREKVAPAIEAEFPDAAPRIAVGLAGPGSECFGYDDAISQDHDFTPRLCLWLTEADAEAFGARLQERYAVWTAEFAPVAESARDRSGVISIPDYYRRFTGCPGVPPDAVSWLRIPEHPRSAPRFWRAILQMSAASGWPRGCSPWDRRGSTTCRAA